MALADDGAPDTSPELRSRRAPWLMQPRCALEPKVPSSPSPPTPLSGPPRGESSPAHPSWVPLEAPLGFASRVGAPPLRPDPSTFCVTYWLRESGPQASAPASEGGWEFTAGHTRSGRSGKGEEETAGTRKPVGPLLTSPLLHPEGGAEPRPESWQAHRPHAHTSATPLPQPIGLGASS